MADAYLMHTGNQSLKSVFALSLLLIVAMPTQAYLDTSVIPLAQCDESKMLPCTYVALDMKPCIVTMILFPLLLNGTKQRLHTPLIP